MAMGFKYLYYNEQKGVDDDMAYEVKITFDEWEEFLNFMTELHNREMRNLEEVNRIDKNQIRFENLEDADEDIEALIQQYPVAFKDTSKNEAEIRKIHLITEKMTKRPAGFLKPGSAITTADIFSRIKGTFKAEEFFLALPMAIAALFRIRCREKFKDGQMRLWQDQMDIALFLTAEHGFNSKGLENALDLLDKYNFVDIDKDYTEDKKKPRWIGYNKLDSFFKELLK